MTPLAKIRIKNCGLRTATDVQVAMESGAEFIGFVIYPPSPRHIAPRDAAALASRLRSHVQSVAVLVDPSDEELMGLLQEWKPDILQLHGDETPERTAEIRLRLGLPVIKAMGIATETDVLALNAYFHTADYLLLDTKHTHERGGTGIPFDWGLLSTLECPIPWFLSGGLDADNVVQAVTRTRAPMVDVSSGIESSRGVKDPEKIRRFNATVHTIR
jgi:phosphoribosylanthranilate isomerase